MTTPTVTATVTKFLHCVAADRGGHLLISSSGRSVELVEVGDGGGHGGSFLWGLIMGHVFSRGKIDSPCNPAKRKGRVFLHEPLRLRQWIGL